jgi:NAD dependent epimerase/dehydratase family enzyme
VKKPQDLWEFSWEKSPKHTTKTEVVAVDKDFVKELAKQWENELKKNN